MLKTPLYDFHAALGARFVPFAGYEMPVQYSLGVMGEHLYTRKNAGLFDVSHMGQVLLVPKSGNIEDACLALETLVPMDICGLKEGRQRYALFTNDNGGILDDLMVAHRGDHLLLVVNAACKKDDIDHLYKHLGTICDIQVIENRALLALQGPKSAKILADIVPQVFDMKFMDVAVFNHNGKDLWVSRSGYTGEDGFEISISASDAEKFAELLIGKGDVEVIGLGARDSLRLEGGLCLYGHDIDKNTSPIEAGLNWSVQKVRREGGARAGGFPGAEIIFDHLHNGVTKKRLGLLPQGRTPMRAGTKIYAHESADNLIGEITSGGFAPSLERPISMGYLKREYCEIGTTVFAEIRGKRLAAHVACLPFVPANFKR